MTSQPNIRIEFTDDRGINGRVWLRHPAPPHDWIDVSQYVTAASFTGNVDRFNTATITFHRASTGAP